MYKICYIEDQQKRFLEKQYFFSVITGGIETWECQQKKTYIKKIDKSVAKCEITQ